MSITFTLIIIFLPLKQSSWETNSHSAGQGIFCIWWNTKVFLQYSQSPSLDVLWHFIPHSHTSLLKALFVFSFHIGQSVLLDFLTKILYKFFMFFVYSQLISFNLITLAIFGEEKGTNYAAFHQAHLFLFVILRLPLP